VSQLVIREDRTVTDAGPTSLSYASTGVRAREGVRIELFALGIPALVMPLVALLGIWLMQTGVLSHNAICPSCGGYGAGLLVTLAVVTGILTALGLGRAIVTRARPLRVVIASFALGLAGLEVAISIGFYHLIQV
jgi:hypothetical protein